MPRMTALLMLRSTPTTVSAPAITHYVAQSHTPRTRSVRFVAGVAVGSRNTRSQAARYGLTWTGLAPADHASLTGAFRRMG
jgi:hypothetical protein